MPRIDRRYFLSVLEASNHRMHYHIGLFNITLIYIGSSLIAYGGYEDGI